MHARRHWITWGLVLTVTCVIGCRGSKPLTRWVQVTHEPSESDDLEAPKQRLATAKPRVEVSVSKEGGPDRSPHVSQVAKQQATKPTSSKRSTTTKPSAATRAILAANRNSDAPATKTANNTQPRGKTDASDNPQELMDAFSQYPPAVQQQALRQLAAAVSRGATSTTQPEALGDALNNKLGDLPTLPDAKNERSEVPPQRIASAETAGRTTATDAAKRSERRGSTETAPKSSQPETDSMASGARASVSDRETTASVSDLETTVVEPIGIESTQDSEVRTASASRSGDHESMVARAIIEPPVTSKSSGTDFNQIGDEALYQVLMQRLTQPVAGESEADRSRRLIMARHLMVLSGDPDGAVAKIDGMGEKEQEYLRHQLLGLWTVINPEGHPVPSRRFTSALPKFREATKYLAAATDSLDVRSLAFCTEIESYGQIKTFPGNNFDAGQQVILYCEIENFTVTKSSDGFETHLQGSYDIFNADNQKVVSQLLPADKQTSNNYLRDYFIAYQMHLPQELAAGTYRLQLTMEDVGGKKYGQAEIPFEIKK